MRITWKCWDENVISSYIETIWMTKLTQNLSNDQKYLENNKNDPKYPEISKRQKYPKRFTDFKGILVILEVWVYF